MADQDDEVSIVVGSANFISWPSVSITRSTDFSFSMRSASLS